MSLKHELEMLGARQHNEFDINYYAPHYHNHLPSSDTQRGAPPGYASPPLICTTHRILRLTGVSRDERGLVGRASPVPTLTATT